MATTRYYTDSRAPRYSILFALPLLLGYEVLALFMADAASGGVRNGADVILKSLFLTVAGSNGLLLFDGVLLVVGTWLVARDWKQHPGGLRASVFAGMLAESAILGVAVGLVVGQLTTMLLPQLAILQGVGALDTSTQLMVSLGAGIYEELLFRVILVGALAWLFTRGLGWTPRAAGIAAAMLGAFIFSAFHYVGAYGDPLRLDSFLFRFIAGLVFSALYLTRGFGITAWTHALYDVYVTLG